MHVCRPPASWVRNLMICALGAMALATWPGPASAKSGSWSRCHGYPRKYHLAVRGRLSCRVAYSSFTDFNTSALPQQIAAGIEAAKSSGSTPVGQWSQLGDRFSYVDYGHRWKCNSPSSVTTCTTSNSMAMRYAGTVYSAPPDLQCSGAQPPYSTSWSGNGTDVTPGPVHTPNMTCALALQVQYADAIGRAGGGDPAQAGNMFRFPQGLQYSLLLPNASSWQCSVQDIVGPSQDSPVLTLNGVSYDTDVYVWRCDSYTVSKLGQEATWSVAEPHCAPQPGSATPSPPPPPPICKS
jgi:hypothetical protein